MSDTGLGAMRIMQAHVQLDDPHLNTDNRDRLAIRFAVYDALVKHGSGGEFRPGLAEGWEVRPDAGAWTFRLRHEALFHNGVTVTSADVVRSLERARDPNQGGEFATQGVFQSYLAGAVIAVAGPYGVRIETPEPMADLLDLLVDLPIVSAEIDPVTHYPLGSGCYRVTSASPGIVTMASFDRHWDRPRNHQQVTWIAEPDPMRRRQAFESGNVDMVSGIPGSVTRDHAAVMSVPSSTCVAFLCNAARGACQDRRVRQALNLALDRVALIDATGQAGARLLNGPLTAFHLGYDPATPIFPYDPGKARSLLAEAGYAGGLHIVIDVPLRMPDEAPILAATMVEQFAKAGITASIREFSDRPGYAEMVRAKQIDDACCFDSTPLSTFRVLREKFYGGYDGPWRQGYRNEAVDRLFEEAMRTTNLAARQALYRQIYRLIRDDAPWIFLYSPARRWAVADHLHWTPNPAGFVELR